MNKIEQIIADMKGLEQELFIELQKKQDEYFYVIKDKKVQFEEETRKYHRALAMRLHTYLASVCDRPRTRLPPRTDWRQASPFCGSRRLSAATDRPRGVQLLLRR